MYKYKPLPSPMITVQENDQCHLLDIQSYVQGSKMCPGDKFSRRNSSSTEDQDQKIVWTCSSCCKSLSDKEIALIVSLKNIFYNDIS